MRIFLNTQFRKIYFQSLKNAAGLTWIELGKKLQVDNRMLRSWRSGEYTIPLEVCKRIEKIFEVKLPPSYKRLSSYWHTNEAGRKGAIKRNSIYGNPATPEGRRKGGLNSLRSPKLKKTNFKFLKPIKTPSKSDKLAELIGIIIGDGSITRFQVRITLDKKRDEKYSFYVKSLFETLFSLKPSVYVLKKRSVVEVTVSSKAVVDYLMESGLPIGNKVAQEIDIPKWIRQDSSFSRFCLRGIFDTDGCVYLDRHKIKGKNYFSINLAVTSASGKLLYSIYEIFTNEGFSPTISSPRSIRIRKSKQIKEFFDKIGSRNPKHIRRFEEFINMERYPSGHKGTVSKTVGI